MMRAMIYLDNAATSYPKPESVYQRIDYILRHIGGNPGSSGHRMAIDASRVIFEARESAARFFNIHNAERIAFTKNATEAINAAFKGILKAGDHVITTSIEHNAVVKPLKRLEKEGVNVTRVKADKEGLVRTEDIEKALTKKTRLVSVVHASNVFGAILPVGEIGRMCRKKGILFMIDAAQTAGTMPIDIELLNIDIFCATGHKSLLGPQGTGFLYVREGLEPLPLIDGGIGEDDEVKKMPERFEAGTMNTPGIGGLAAGVEFILSVGVDAIMARETALVAWLIEGISGIKGARIIGTREAGGRVGLVAFTLEGMTPTAAGLALDREFSIMVRTGTHCAPGAHREAGTFPEGAIRVSPSYMNTDEDIEAFLKAIKSISGRC